MTTTIRRVGEPGLLRYSRFKPEHDEHDGHPRWRVVGELRGCPGAFQHVVWCDSEEHALLAVLFLAKGGHVKVNGNVITDDQALPRRHATEPHTFGTVTKDEAAPIDD